MQSSLLVKCKSRCGDPSRLQYIQLHDNADNFQRAGQDQEGFTEPVMSLKMLCFQCFFCHQILPGRLPCVLSRTAVQIIYHAPERKQKFLKFIVRQVKIKQKNTGLYATE